MLSNVFGQKSDVMPVNFNSPDSDFAPVFYQNGLVFSSNRLGKLFDDDIDSLKRFYTDLFFVDLDEAGAALGEPRIFSKELTTFLNEGPCVFNNEGNVIYYTGNILPEKTEKEKKVEEYRLGIFSAKLIGDKFLESTPLIFNSTNNKYNCAHPALSPDNKMLVFTSNMDQKNNTDLFFCTWEDGNWSAPKNMGNPINSNFTEVFPYFNSSGVLHFSSNRKFGKKDFEVYRSEFVNEKWTKPQLLPKGINSEFDDFGYTEAANGLTGFLSSNRIGPEDDIFSFRYQFPELVNCKQNARQTFCFQIEEEIMINLDTLPLRYEWDLGDGNTLPGISVKHCYADTGQYLISLNIRDTTTNQLFVNISQNILIVEHENRPFILGPDTLLLSDECTLICELPTEQDAIYYWKISDKSEYIGNNKKHNFSRQGNYQLVLGAQLTGDSVADSPTTCVYKQISVFQNREELLAAKEKNRLANEKTALLPEQHVRTSVRMLDEKLNPIQGGSQKILRLDTLSGEIREQGKFEHKSILIDSPLISNNANSLVSETQNSEQSALTLLRRIDISDVDIIKYFTKFQNGQELTPLKYVSENPALPPIQQSKPPATLSDGNPQTTNPEKTDSESRTLEMAANELLVDKQIKFSSNQVELAVADMNILRYISVIMDIESTAQLIVAAQIPTNQESNAAQTLFEQRIKEITSVMVSFGVDKDRIKKAIYPAVQPTGALVDISKQASDGSVIEFRIAFDHALQKENQED